MKLKNLILIFICCVISQVMTGQMYVDQSATGASDGSSWDNAFTDIQDALDAAEVGAEIWIAAGTYLPPIDDNNRDASFVFPYDMSLYGGFAGTETSRDERDIAANETILSGDHNGDDGAADQLINREDNSRHIIWLTDTITNNTIIDGITFMGGTTDDGDGSGNDRRGGGILSYGAPIVQNCTFTSNYGYYGGGIYPRGSDSEGAIIRSCNFINNFGENGSGVYCTAPSMTISDCLFESNMAQSYGGGIYTTSSDGILVEDCSFIKNTVLEWRGGGVYNNSSPSTYKNCYFEENVSTGSTGGGLFVRHTVDDRDYEVLAVVDSCTFIDNSGSWGGAFGNYNPLSHALVQNSTFENNHASSAGGAVTNGFSSQTTYRNCNFTGNSAGSIGGAVFNQNDSSTLHFIECSITNNEAERGGAMTIRGDDEPLSTTPLTTLIVERCEILGNSALEQGGGLNISNVNLELKRSLVAQNLVINAGSIGGGLSLNTGDSLTTEFVLTGNTIVLNDAELGAGISNWNGGDSTISSLTLTNNILYNPSGNDYEIEQGLPPVSSGGGNSSSDATLADYLTEEFDIIETNPLFVNELLDYNLVDGSPCVNTGISISSDTVDILGNPIVATVDKGAYENQQSVGTKEQLSIEDSQFLTYPNPVVNTLFTRLSNDWRGNVHFTIYNSEGKTVRVKDVHKYDEVLRTSLPLRTLAKGGYIIEARNGNRTLSKQIVKN